jgi:hypothetical protein
MGDFSNVDKLTPLRQAVNCQRTLREYLNSQPVKMTNRDHFFEASCSIDHAEPLEFLRAEDLSWTKRETLAVEHLAIRRQRSSPRNSGQMIWSKRFTVIRGSGKAGVF